MCAAQVGERATCEKPKLPHFFLEFSFMSKVQFLEIKLVVNVVFQTSAVLYCIVYDLFTLKARGRPGGNPKAFYRQL